MPIAVTGSVATDHLMSFSGRFADVLLPDQLASLSVVFLSEDLQVRRGGTGGNIAFGMARLGRRPLLVAAVGPDVSDYLGSLADLGVDTAGVLVTDDAHTARFTCTTDTDQNQVATFYAGAMLHAREIDLVPHLPLDLVLISANDPVAMVRHTQQAREHGVPFAADPSQQLSSLSTKDVRELVDGAAYLFTNEYEAALVDGRSGWSTQELLGRVGVRVTTLGAKGVVLERVGTEALFVPAVPGVAVADPTGAGDAFRAGFLAAREWGVDLVRAAQVGSVLAAYALEGVGPQDYTVAPAAFLDRLAEVYGEEARAEVAPHLS
ncbi:MAG TPA: carbohydrate kinase family protein [Frankiaceae bacterium]